MPTKSNEWYTPARYIEAAREVMGGIDLDPSSCKEANMIVRAEKFYTKEDNGLLLPWHGNVWLNPPYSLEGVPSGKEAGRQIRSVVRQWIDRLINEYRAGNISEAILLTKADPKQLWFQLLWEFPICFASDRVYFHRPHAEPERHFFGTAFIYLGSNEQKFIDTFSKFGTIAKRVSQPRQTVQMLSLWEVSP